MDDGPGARQHPSMSPGESAPTRNRIRSATLRYGEQLGEAAPPRLGPLVLRVCPRCRMLRCIHPTGPWLVASSGDHRSGRVAPPAPSVGAAPVGRFALLRGGPSRAGQHPQMYPDGGSVPGADRGVLLRSRVSGVRRPGPKPGHVRPNPEIESSTHLRGGFQCRRQAGIARRQEACS